MWVDTQVNSDPAPTEEQVLARVASSVGNGHLIGAMYHRRIWAVKRHFWGLVTG